MPAGRLSRAARRDEHEAAGAQAARVHAGPTASHYAVIGTPNLLEYDQGFFVKGGDGLADVKPIAGLYKSQVYALARELGLPEGIANRAPTTETFSLPQTQEEFYFGHPYERMDLLVWGHDEGVPAAELAPRVGPDPGRGRGRLRRDRAPAGRDRVPARAGGPARRLGLRCAGSAESFGPSRARRSTSRRCCGWPARSATAGPDGFGLLLDHGAGLVSTRLAIIDLPDGWQPLEAGRQGAALVYNGEVYNHIELRAELEAARGDVRDPQRHRGGPAAARARRPRRRSTRLNGQFALRLVAARGAPADPGPRPLRRPAAALLAARRRHARLRLGGQGAVRLRRGRRRARPGGDRRRVHALGPAGAADRVRGRAPGAAGRPGRLGARRDRRRAALVGPRVR